MKRLLLSLSFIICHLTFSIAQTGLHINELFEGNIIPRERMVETRVRGKTLAKYQLTFYRSLRFSASTEEVAHLRRIIDEDGRGHHATGTEAGKTYTMHIQLSPQGGKNRFLCYQDVFESKKKPREVTVIYMEGTISDIYKLEALINKK
ncbi:MAG: DUF6108 family protein [Prevotella sp.]|jgi:hypothetical protein|nr:DUF6108 family protein [Prevotella sp.]